MQRRGTATVVVCALFMVAPTALANLVSNGDFETGTYSPQWTLSPGGPFDYVCKAGDPVGAATCITHGGQYAMSFGLAGGQDSLSQNIPTVAGGLYTLSFFLANSNPLDQNTTTFDVYWDGRKVYSLTSPQPSFPYQAVTLVASTTSNSTPLAFVAQNDPSQWFLDDVSVVQNAVSSAPIPTLTDWGTLLMALLLAGLAARPLRRKRGGGVGSLRVAWTDARHGQRAKGA